MKKVILRHGRERAALRRHPWIFSGAIKSVVGNPANGETVQVLSADGTSLARGAYSAHSQISVRVWSFDVEEEIDAAFFRHRIADAAVRREQSAGLNGVTAMRLVNAESDGLPGLIVDRYSDWLVCQFLSAGAEYMRADITAALQDITRCAGIVDRSDPDARGREGLPESGHIIVGKEPPDCIEIWDGACKFAADIRSGQKTGFYLDQRENRKIAAEYAAGAEVLDCFCYTGGFAVHALKAGAARVTCVDSSASALALLARNVVLNGLNAAAVEPVEGDVFDKLRRFRDSRRQFDMIVLDPPKFVESAGQVGKGSRAYKDINLLAFKLLKLGGVLCTFSCSGHMPPDLFQKVVADGAIDAGRDAQIIRVLGQPEDHPVGLQFPEGSYLKGLICRV